MSGAEPSRAVTRARCVVCEKTFKKTRRDARYCSGACRQQAARARAGQTGRDDLLREIDEAKAHYWALVRRYREAYGSAPDHNQFVTAEGDVYIRGQLVGHAEPIREGWASWGNENAGPPFSPPTGYMHKHFGPHAG